MGTAMYDSHQGLCLVSLWFDYDRLNWVSIRDREHSGGELAQSTLH
jgi:hypothetical protein